VTSTSKPSRVQVGIWQSIPSPMVSRYLAKMGWDWIVLDMQHGSMSFETAYECVQTIRAGGARPIVRVGIDRPFEVQRALDIGAGGVVIPMVNSLATAREMARAAKYPPQGERSFGSDAAIVQGADYHEQANAETLLLVQVEHKDAVAVVEEMLAIDGVDGCFVGPTDLALSMGLSRHGYANHADHRAAMQRIVAAAKTTGKLACCNTYDPDDFAEKAQAGYDAITLMSDVDLLMGSGGKLLKELRARAGI
jgi:2-keto-3-deoxy-L-rhamnonate aldolase RhmA